MHYQQLILALSKCKRRRWHEMALFKKKKKEEEFVWVDLDDDYEWTEPEEEIMGTSPYGPGFHHIPPQRQPQDIPRTKNKRKTNKRQRQRQIPSMEQMPSDNRATYDTYNSHYGEPYDSGFGADDLPMDYEYDEDIIAQIQKKKNKKLKIILVTLGYLLFIVIGIFSTTYVNGWEAQIVDVKLRELRNYYYFAEERFEIIDWAMQNSLDKNFNTGPRYELASRYGTLIDTLKKELTTVNSISPPKEFASVNELLLSCIDKEILYLERTRRFYSQGGNQTARDNIQATFNEFEFMYNRINETLDLMAKDVKLERNKTGIRNDINNE